MSYIVLVDKRNKVVGYKEKFEAHKNPVPLHRAISVVIYSTNRKKMLIQRRSAIKPTWPLFWSNACCTHPYKDESCLHAAKRRLKEEMGIETPLSELFKFIYKKRYNKIWGEHELDFVFEGLYQGSLFVNPLEVSEHKWVEVSKLLKDVKENPDIYTPWFKIILKKIYKEKFL